MVMSISNHGGKCCGIKHIFGFYALDTVCSALVKANQNNKDANGHNVSSSDNFFTDEAPEEVLTDRFNRYVEYLKVRRPSGIVEVTLVHGYQDDWVPILKKKDFKEVSNFYNSNSGNTVTIYHLCLYKGKPLKKGK